MKNNSVVTHVSFRKNWHHQLQEQRIKLTRHSLELLYYDVHNRYMYMCVVIYNANYYTLNIVQANSLIRTVFNSYWYEAVRITSVEALLHREVTLVPSPSLPMYACQSAVPDQVTGGPTTTATDSQPPAQV